METYGVITPGEEVFDHDMQGGEEDDDDNIEFPDEVKVNHSGDIKDEQCFIVYKKNLLQLVTFLLNFQKRWSAESQNAQVPYALALTQWPNLLAAEWSLNG